MANSLLSKDQISNIDPGWSHPVLPGHAVQGSLLLTRSDFVNPPQSSDMFIWKPMEDIVGIHDIRFKYYESDNTYHFYKTYGHLNNNDEWIEDVYDIGHFNALTDEAAENLKNMKYLKYTFTYANNVYKIEGLLKDGTTETILEIEIPSLSEFQNEVEDRKKADEALQNSINTEIQNRKDGDTTITNNLNTEVQNRKDADTTITNNLNAEITDRKNADTILQSNINNEAQDRKNADTTLQNNIDKKQDKLTAGENITISADNVISSKGGGEIYTAGENIVIFDNVISARDTTYTAGENITISSDNVISSKDTALAEQVNTNTTDIATNRTRIDTCKDDIETNTTNIATNTASINTLKTDVASNKVIAGDQISVSTTSTGSTIAMKGTSEQWTFTLEDGSTVTKTVRCF